MGWDGIDGLDEREWTTMWIDGTAELHVCENPFTKFNLLKHPWIHAGVSPYEDRGRERHGCFGLDFTRGLAGLEQIHRVIQRTKAYAEVRNSTMYSLILASLLY